MLSYYVTVGNRLHTFISLDFPFCIASSDTDWEVQAIVPFEGRKNKNTQRVNTHQLLERFLWHAEGSSCFLLTLEGTEATSSTRTRGWKSTRPHPSAEESVYRRAHTFHMYGPYRSLKISSHLFSLSLSLRSGPRAGLSDPRGSSSAPEKVSWRKTSSPSHHPWPSPSSVFPRRNEGMRPRDCILRGDHAPPPFLRLPLLHCSIVDCNQSDNALLFSPLLFSFCKRNQ